MSKPRESVNEVSKDAPVLTLDHKNKILMLQRQILTCQLNIQNSQKQLEQLSPALNTLLTTIAKDLDVDVNKYALDLDTMSLIPKA